MINKNIKAAIIALALGVTSSSSFAVNAVFRVMTESNPSTWQNASSTFSSWVDDGDVFD